MEFLAANDFAELIGLMKRSKRRGTCVYSYNELAARFGYKSPRSLAMVHKSQRAPSAALVRNICDFLKVSSGEREFVQWLAEKSRLRLKRLSVETVDLRIQNFRAASLVAIEKRIEIGGVFIEIDPSAPESLKKRMKELVRALIYEFGALSREPVAKDASEFATGSLLSQNHTDDRSQDFGQ